MSDELIKSLKRQAKLIAAQKLVAGHELKHGHALEVLSKALGYRNWNTLRALAAREPSKIQNVFDLYRAKAERLIFASVEPSRSGEKAGDWRPPTILKAGNK